MAQTARERRHDTSQTMDRRRSVAIDAPERRVANRRWHQRPDWLTISGTPSLRTSRECLDCWAL